MAFNVTARHEQIPALVDLYRVVGNAFLAQVFLLLGAPLDVGPLGIGTF
jgi:hypothetical protein